MSVWNSSLALVSRWAVLLRIASSNPSDILSVSCVMLICALGALALGVLSSFEIDSRVGWELGRGGCRYHPLLSHLDDP